ncbi:hypothetical protein [Sulfurimonas sp.]|uniref:hypothetical protein n=1 Tax=Sulfurimonas sp. TaxID=2022749 RepID=UPI0025E698BA|nr:hypothetical protein [Sulfurimonas sp.]
MLVVKIGKKETEVKNRAVESALNLFVETKQKIDGHNEDLKKAKEILIAEARIILGDDDTSTITFGVDDDKVKITFGYDIKVSDEDALKKMFGDRFDDLVTVKTVVTPGVKLKEMALDDDGLKMCLTVKEKAPAVAVVK